MANVRIPGDKAGALCPGLSYFQDLPRFAGEVDRPREAIRRIRYAVACRTVEDAVKMLERLISEKGG